MLYRILKYSLNIQKCLGWKSFCKFRAQVDNMNCAQYRDATQIHRTQLPAAVGNYQKENRSQINDNKILNAKHYGNHLLYCIGKTQVYKC